MSTRKGFRSANQLTSNLGADNTLAVATGVGSPPVNKKAGEERPKMKLTQEEQDIFDNKAGDKKGEILSKCMKTVVEFGDLFGAPHLVDLDYGPHHAMSWGSGGIIPFLEIYEELADAGLKCYGHPFCSNPLPFDYENMDPGPEAKAQAEQVWNTQQRLQDVNYRLGMLKDGYACTPYLPEIGPGPKKGDMLAWTESSAICYSNSAIGARTNRNSIGIDMMCSILGKAPYFGLLTDEGRKADWLIDVRVDHPHPEHLGAMIGTKLIESVPYIIGMNEYLGNHDDLMGYLKDFGAGMASTGAIGLYHVDGVTPEAKEQGRDLLNEGYQTYVIDQAEYERVYKAYPILWEAGAKPEKVWIGCPLVTFDQLKWWANALVDALEKAGRKKVALPTFIASHQLVTDHFDKDEPELARRVADAGIKMSRNCPMMYCQVPLQAKEHTVTNANKTRVYTTMRLLPDADLIHAAVTGEIPEHK